MALLTLRRHWLLTAIALVALVLVVYSNTIVHPYLLADNRHYTFYIWNKFFGRYWWARYVVVPGYIVAAVAVYKAMDTRQSAGFLLIFGLCTIAALAFQQMIEVRYFFIPYLVIRLHAAASPKWRYLLLEFGGYVVLNASVLYIFHTKTINWSDFEAPQRLIW